MKKVFQVTVLLLLVLSFASQAALAQDAEETEEAEQTEASTPAAICESALPIEEPETRDYEEPEFVIDIGVDYQAIFCTEVGPVYVDLYETYAPATVNNFIFLAENDYYNNTTFHRVLENFMAQGGDPTGTGSGGPGYQFQDEFVSFLTFDRVGLLAMANANRPEQGVVGTNGSQFFLTTEVTDWLNYRHTIFGEVLQGQDIVESLPLRDPASATDPGAALDTVVIVTDPAMVDAEVVTEDVAPAGIEAFEAAIGELPELPPSLVVNEDVSGAYETEALVALDESASEDFAELLDTFNHNFSYLTKIVSTDCNLEAVQFASVGYTVHVFDTAADATAVVNSDELVVLATLGHADDFELLEDSAAVAPVFVSSADACGEDGELGYMVRQNGRFVIVSDILLPINDAPINLWLDQIVNTQIFDIVFGDVLLSELRNR